PPRPSARRRAASAATGAFSTPATASSSSTPLKVTEDFAICDLITGEGWRVKADPDCADIIWNGWSDDDDNKYEQENEGVTWNAAVLCAKDGCDHIYCHGGPFLVALVGSDEEQRMTFAAAYSSETRK
uniref:Uncharacterized protein n=1 Tax=Aegilops tauschii subsp. strangulata TaxID=200361 RepID=A0A453IVK8_AEGTS